MLKSRPIARFKEFMLWLIKQYREVLEFAARSYPFRIVDEHRQPRTGKTIFTIQFVGKSTIIKLDADEIANDDDLIQGFSPRDVKRIVKASLTKQALTVIAGGSGSCKIIAKNLNAAQNKPTYTVEHTDDNEKVTTTMELDEVTRSKDLLLKFSKQDIFEIAYTAGASSILSAQDDIKPKRS